MKGEKRLKILEFVESSAKLIEAAFYIFSLPRGTSYSCMMSLLQKRQGGAFLIKTERQVKMRFNDLIYHLKKDGLVNESKKGNKLFLELTNKGQNILDKVRTGKSTLLPDNKYKSEDEKILKIIIFDIPERDRRKRSWLRFALKNLKFKMLQKSVWVGKAKLPREFMEDLKRLGLLSYVEIFAVTKSGSLKQI